MGSKVEIEEQPNPRDVATVRRGLDEYNLAFAGDYNRKALTVFLRGGNDEVIGGLLARTYWGYLNIDILWIAEEHRNEGHGKRLLNVAEEEAIRRGCRYSSLDTYTFQAVPFYQKNGYSVVGEFEDFPPGYNRYFMRKALLPGTPKAN